ncbi:hypothetical protein XENORESO_021528 [Xenotaenia resolanae]|uniref:Uncharacterized protein n=1 Tax=Xenotaenia resolanae TaxID=208358 RepID=A0ABV0WU58_9TELE
MFDFSLTIWPLLALFATDLLPPSSFLARRTTRLVSHFGIHSPSPDRAACLQTPIWIYPASLSSPRSCRSMILSFHLLRKRPKILLPSVAEVDLLHLLHIPACLLHAASPLIFVSQTDPPAPQASTSSSTPVILQSSLLHAYRPWILSSAPFISLNISRVRLQLGHISFLFSALPAPSPLLGPSHRRSRR